jgi:hypothetical protein
MVNQGSKQLGMTRESVQVISWHAVSFLEKA